MLYIAAPYTKLNKADKKACLKLVREIATELTLRGVMSYSPLTYSVQVSKSRNFRACAVDYEFDTDAFWRAHGLRMLAKCDAILIVTFDGWSMSSGVDAEWNYAANHDLPIHYIGLPSIDDQLDVLADMYSETGFNVNDTVDQSDG